MNRKGFGSKLAGKIHLKVNENGTFSATFEPTIPEYKSDEVGAFYFVMAVILIYAFSILLMIVSYIRKNKDDRRLKKYLQEMAFLRKRELRETLMSLAVKAATVQTTQKNDSLSERHTVLMANQKTREERSINKPNKQYQRLSSYSQYLNDKRRQHELCSCAIQSEMNAVEKNYFIDNLNLKLSEFKTEATINSSVLSVSDSSVTGMDSVRQNLSISSTEDNSCNLYDQNK